MKKILFLAVALLASQWAFAQQFSLPILPEKMWPSDYAKYETDILNCCNYLLTSDPTFNHPKHEECSSFLVRWLSGTPEVSIPVSADLTDVKKPELLMAYLAAWTRQALQYKDTAPIVCANVAVEEMLRYYESYKESVGKSSLTEKLIKAQSEGKLAAIVAKALTE